MPHILLIDNTDSFTYNLVHLCHHMLMAETGATGHIEVYRPDEITVEGIQARQPQLILISPGPGSPAEATLSQQVVLGLGEQFPIFGVCLGMQVMAECLGAEVIRGTPLHGKTDQVYHTGRHPLFNQIPSPFKVVRYHSLKVDNATLNGADAVALAQTQDGTMMALASTQHPMVWGVQFHPESIGSEAGLQLMTNVYRAACSIRVESKPRLTESACSN